MNFVLLVIEALRNKIVHLYAFLLPVIATAGDEKPTIRSVPIEYIKRPTDYSERRSLAISIPDYSLIEVNNDKFYVSLTFNERSSIEYSLQAFNIHIGGNLSWIFMAFDG